MHADDEIRLILDGSGFFDIRDPKDKWVRICVEKGDLITLPAGSYHRFTTDDKVDRTYFFLLHKNIPLEVLAERVLNIFFYFLGLQTK